MAQVKIAGDAVVIVSSLKLEDLKKAEKYAPKALVIRGGEDGKEEIFRISTTTGTGGLNKNGAIFGSQTHDENKYAAITVVLSRAVENPKEFVAEEFGVALGYLNELEKTLPRVIEGIDSRKTEIMNSITVVQ